MIYDISNSTKNLSNPCQFYDSFIHSLTNSDTMSYDSVFLPLNVLQIQLKAVQSTPFLHSRFYSYANIVADRRLTNIQ